MPRGGEARSPAAERAERLGQGVDIIQAGAGRRHVGLCTHAALVVALESTDRRPRYALALSVPIPPATPDGGWASNDGTTAVCCPAVRMMLSVARRTHDRRGLGAHWVTAVWACTHEFVLRFWRHVARFLGVARPYAPMPCEATSERVNAGTSAGSASKAKAGAASEVPA